MYELLRMETKFNMIYIHTKSLEPFANGFESFVTSTMNMDKKTMNKMQCNFANSVLLYAPRDENFESMCDAYHEHYQCDCTDPEKYNFEDEGRFLILNHYLRITQYVYI